TGRSGARPGDTATREQPGRLSGCRVAARSGPLGPAPPAPTADSYGGCGRGRGDRSKGLTGSAAPRSAPANLARLPNRAPVGPCRWPGPRLQVLFHGRLLTPEEPLAKLATGSQMLGLASGGPSGSREDCRPPDAGTHTLPVSPTVCAWDVTRVWCSE